MYIDKETLKRVNIAYEYKGFSKLDTPEIREKAGVIEIAEPQAPQEAQEHPDWYIVSESEYSPYIIWSRRSEQIIYDIELAKAQNARAIEYKNTSDPLFFKEQRGEVEAGTWLKAVQDIKDKYPYPEKPIGEVNG